MSIDKTLFLCYNKITKRKENFEMKCAICKNKTTWDESYGYYEFIVCPHCHNRLGKYNIENYPQILDFIFECGKLDRKIRRNQNENFIS